jgi:hypothetical protein
MSANTFNGVRIVPSPHCGSRVSLFSVHPSKAPPMITKGRQERHFVTIYLIFKVREHSTHTHL